MSMYTSALDIRGMSRVTAVSPPVHSKRGWAGKTQWQVSIIQFITTFTIIFKCICKLCSLLFCRFKQIKIIFTQIVINIICQRTDHCRLYSSASIFLTVQNNLTPSLEMDKFCALDTFPHSGSGQARLIKALCSLSKHSSGPLHWPGGTDLLTMWQIGADFKGRTAAAAGWKEGSVYACPSLAVLRNEGKDSLNRCSSFQGWKS